MQEYRLKAAPEDSAKRLDLFLMDYFNQAKPGLSRTSLQKIILDGKVSVNGVCQQKPHLAVKVADEIKVIIEEKKTYSLNAEDIPLDVVFEDSDIAVLNKPSGLVVHPAPGNLQHTLAHALVFRFKELSSINPQRPGIVHRLDKETSGLLLIAKNNFSHLALSKQFAAHSITRKYVALVKGRMEFNEDIIELPIGRHPVKRESMSVAFGGHTKYAKTHYRCLKRDNEFSLLELSPFTGRTHQLRVHLSFVGHPILGDAKYGRNNDFCRLALHAKTIGFIHPSSNKYLEFSSAIPEEFSAFVKSRKMSNEKYT